MRPHVKGWGGGSERHRAAGGSTDRLFGLRQESPGAAQQSEEGKLVCVRSSWGPGQTVF